MTASRTLPLEPMPSAAELRAMAVQRGVLPRNGTATATKGESAAYVRNERGGFSGEHNPNWKGGSFHGQCEHCGTDYTTRRAHKGKGRFCSLTCANAWQEDHNAAPGRPLVPRVRAVCVQCAAEADVTPGRLRKASQFFCTPRCSAAWRIENSSRMPNPKLRSFGGKRSDLGDRYFRSAWEANYARILNWRVDRGDIAKWEYEAETFWFEKIKRGARTYTPDFRITRTDGSVYFVEIKGYMDMPSATRLKRMRKYFPATEVVLIQRNEYRSLRDMFAGFLPNWEHTGV